MKDRSNSFTWVCALALVAFAAFAPSRVMLTASAASDGSSIYSQKCSSCHKADGKGGGPFPALAGNAAVTAKDPAAMIAIVKNGKGIMPAYKSQLSNADIAAVMTFVRTSWGNKASAVTEKQVAAVH